MAQRVQVAEDAAAGVVELLHWVGEDPDREGLRDTPGRVLRALREMTDGYDMDPVAILRKAQFQVAYDELVVVGPVAFTSICEHHILPFTGTATVGYIPAASVVGLSKLARVVEVYAHRLQVQERMTAQIAQVIDQTLGPVGVGVVVRAHHSCMGCRGVKQPGAQMVTSSLLGALRSKPEARAEFLSLTGGGL